MGATSAFSFFWRVSPKCAPSLGPEPRSRARRASSRLFPSTVVGPAPQTHPGWQRSPKCSASRLLIEELNSRVLLGNWLLGAGAEQADVISEPRAAAARPRAPPTRTASSPRSSRGEEPPPLGDARAGAEQSAGWGWGFWALPVQKLCSRGGGVVKSAQSRPRNPQSRHRIEASSSPVALVDRGRPAGTRGSRRWQSPMGGTRARVFAPPALGHRVTPPPSAGLSATFPRFRDPRGRSREGRRRPGRGRASRGAGCRGPGQRAGGERGALAGPSASQARPCPAVRPGPSRVGFGCWGGSGGWCLGRRTGAHSAPFPGHHRPWL